MKKIYLKSSFLLVVSLIAISCQENDRMVFSDNPSVYFSSLTQNDSISYSFASGKTNEDTVSIPIKIIGPSVSYDRTISFIIDPVSTAKEGVQFKELNKEVTLPAGAVTTKIDIIVLNKDLENSDVRLIIDLQSNEYFNLGFTENLKAKLVITNQLVKPTYWDMPLSFYYGDYSKAKHRLCIQIQGFDFPPTMDFKKVSDYMSYGRLVYNYLLKTPVWDEDTQKWITADWSPL